MKLTLSDIRKRIKQEGGSTGFSPREITKQQRDNLKQNGYSVEWIRPYGWPAYFRIESPDCYYSETPCSLPYQW